MITLLEVARKAWPFGNPPLDMGVEDGIVWAVSKAPLYGVNGYVLIPAEGHPWSNGVPSEARKYSADDDFTYEHYATEDLDVHDGITYGGGYGTGKGGWIGFDTAHSGDTWVGEFDTVSPTSGEAWSSWMGGTGWDKWWTLDMVIEEAQSLARQLAAVS